MTHTLRACRHPRGQYQHEEETHVQSTIRSCQHDLYFPLLFAPTICGERTYRRTEASDRNEHMLNKHKASQWAHAEQNKASQRAHAEQKQSIATGTCYTYTHTHIHTYTHTHTRIHTHNTHTHTHILLHIHTYTHTHTHTHIFCVRVKE